MIAQLILDEYRPYYDSEVPEAVARIASDSLFEPIVKFVFPQEDYGSFVERFKRLQTVYSFQAEIMDKAIGNIVKQTATSLTYSGVEQLDTDTSYTYISNHRDIVLDSAILQTIFYANGIKTSEITFGNNLMKPQIVVDIGKVNKMFKIIRGGSAKEIFINSMNVSKYMRYAITCKHESTWIAQRSGRTKDGDDRTQVAVLKMLSMSGSKEFVDDLAEMNIVPIAVSYEYEPCDFLKTREIYISRRQTYIKTDNEDLNSIVTGIMQFKGGINYTICPAICLEELQRCDSLPQKDRFKELAAIIDARIYAGYQLFKTNYIAFDCLEKTNRFADRYTLTDKESFVGYMEKGLEAIEGDKNELREIFLNIYANPVKNKIESGFSL